MHFFNCTVSLMHIAFGSFVSCWGTTQVTGFTETAVIRVVERLGHRKLWGSVYVALLFIRDNIEVCLSFDVIWLVTSWQPSSIVKIEFWFFLFDSSHSFTEISFYEYTWKFKLLYFLYNYRHNLRLSLNGPILFIKLVNICFCTKHYCHWLLRQRSRWNWYTKRVHSSIAYFSKSITIAC